MNKWEEVDDKPEVDWEAEYHELYNELIDTRRVLNEIMEKVQARLENREEETINIPFETTYDVPDVCKNCSNYKPGEIMTCACTLPYMTWTCK